MKKFLSFLMVILLSLTLASCNASSSDEQTTITEDTLVVGMEAGYQPFNWTVYESSENTLPIYGTVGEYADGYDVAIAKYLANDLGRNVVIKRTVWDSLIPDLNSGEINMVLAGMTATEERKKEIAFTDPYLESELAFLIQKKDIPAGNSIDNPMKYADLLELFRGKALICQANVVGDGFIDTYFSNDENKEYGIKHLDPAKTYPFAAQDVANGQAFAMPAELPVIQAMSNIDSAKLGVLYVDKYDFLSDDDLNGLTVSIGVKKDNVELLNDLNESLNRLSDDKRNDMMGSAAIRSAQNASDVKGNSNWTLIVNNFKWIGYGILTTLILALVGTFVGLIFGIFIAYGKNIKVKEMDNIGITILKYFIKGLCYVYSTVLRGTPMMVQALLFKYLCLAMGLNWALIQIPGEAGNVLNGWLVAGIVVITLNTAAYMAEIVKSGLNGVDAGQREGALSLGFSEFKTSVTVILPQAIRNALPTIGNELIVNIKDSSVLNVIAVTELYFRMNTIATQTYAFLTCYIILACIYLVLTLLAAGGLKLIEKKLDGVKFSLNPFRKKRGSF